MPSVLDHIDVLAIKVKGKVLPASYLARISTLDVDEKEDHATEIAWSVAYIDGTSSGVDDPFCHEKDPVEVVFGWFGRMSRKHQGKIFAIDGPQLTASGAGWIVKVRDNSTDLKGHSTRRPITGQAAHIIYDICLRRGLTAYLPTSQGVVRAVSALTTDLPEVFKRVYSDVQAHQSDSHMLKHLASRTGHSVRVEGSNLFFDAPDYAKGAVRDFIWNDGKGSLMEFKPATKTEGHNKGKATETKAIAVDKAKRKVVQNTSNDTTEKGRPVLAKGGMFLIEDVKGKGWNEDTTGHTIASPDADKGADHAKTQMTKHEATPVQATAELIGDPTLKRGDILRFINVGQKNSGHWRVLAVKHKVGATGYQTSCGLHRHGPSKSKDKSSGKVNLSKPGESLRKATVAVKIVNGKEVVEQ